VHHLRLGPGVVVIAAKPSTTTVVLNETLKAHDLQVYMCPDVPSAVELFESVVAVQELRLTPQREVPMDDKAQALSGVTFVDVVFLDLDLPNQSGFSLGRRLREIETAAQHRVSRRSTFIGLSLETRSLRFDACWQNKCAEVPIDELLEVPTMSPAIVATLGKFLSSCPVDENGKPCGPIQAPGWFLAQQTLLASPRPINPNLLSPRGMPGLDLQDALLSRKDAPTAPALIQVKQVGTPVTNPIKAAPASQTTKRVRKVEPQAIDSEPESGENQASRGSASSFMGSMLPIAKDPMDDQETISSIRALPPKIPFARTNTVMWLNEAHRVAKATSR